MSTALLFIKNLFKLGLIALQYSIVRLNLDTHSKVLSKFVSSTSEAPKVNELLQKSIPTKREHITMESDAPPYVGNSDNIRAFSRKDVKPLVNKGTQEDKLHEWLP